jgi:cell division protein FtsB
MNKIIFIIVIVIVAVSILTGLGKQIVTALDAGKRLEDEANKVTKLTERNTQLKKELAQAQSPDSVEKTAREELNLAKPEETVVVIPPELINQVLEENKPKVESKSPNWQGWLKLFTH